MINTLSAALVLTLEKSRLAECECEDEVEVLSHAQKTRSETHHRTQASPQAVRSQLFMVDLAGSERVSNAVWCHSCQIAHHGHSGQAHYGQRRARVLHTSQRAEGARIVSRLSPYVCFLTVSHPGNQLIFVSARELHRSQRFQLHLEQTTTEATRPENTRAGGPTGGC